MKPYPHVYKVDARGQATGMVPISGEGLPELPTAPPPEFDGPGDVWSPESLLVASLANCLILTFRGVTRASKFEWTSIEVAVEGTLERAEGVTRFTKYRTRAKLTVPAGTDRAKATQLLERAEHVCLISNSVNGTRELETEVVEQ